MSFLPVDYQAPKGASYYMRLNEGENRVRIMSRPVIGWEDWKDKKPVRFTMDKKPLKSIDPKKPVKHFWAFVVFNYQEEQIQILQVSQASIRKSIEALCNDTDWGDPYAYDIKIMKTGEGVDTEYTVNPVPHKPIEPYLVTCFVDRPCYLEALFDNEDPFNIVDGKITPRATGEEKSNKKVVELKTKDKDLAVSENEVKELGNLLTECSDEFNVTVRDFMIKQGFDTYSELPREAYDRMRKKALEERLKNKKQG